jgi:hypothetical protein
MRFNMLERLISKGAIHSIGMGGGLGNDRGDGGAHGGGSGVGDGGGRSGGGRGSSGAGSNQSAQQGRGGQADVGGKNSPTGDSADNGDRDTGGFGGFRADYGFSEKDLNDVGIAGPEGMNPHGNINNRGLSETGPGGLNDGDLQKAGITGIDHTARARARAALAHKDDSYGRTLAHKEQQGTLNPTEKDTLNGIRAGMTHERAKNTIGGILSGGITKAASALGAIPGVAKLGGMLASNLGMETMKPEDARHTYSEDGFALGEQMAEPTTMESAIGFGLGMVAPPLGIAAPTMMEMYRNRDMANPNQPSTEGNEKNSGGQVSGSSRAKASAAMRSPSAPQPAKSPSQHFSSTPSLIGYNRDAPIASRTS